jgi:hypothetical protein
VRGKAEGLLGEFRAAAEELVRLSADGITTTCGFPSLYQRQISAHVGDVTAAERDILAAGEALVSDHREVGAVLLECTNMEPFARALSRRLRLPVFSIYTFVTWFHAGLVPRNFGYPTSAPREWRER